MRGICLNNFEFTAFTGTDLGGRRLTGGAGFRVSHCGEIVNVTGQHRTGITLCVANSLHRGLIAVRIENGGIGTCGVEGGSHVGDAFGNKDLGNIGFIEQSSANVGKCGRQIHEHTVLYVIKLFQTEG